MRIGLAIAKKLVSMGVKVVGSCTSSAMGYELISHFIYVKKSTYLAKSISGYLLVLILKSAAECMFLQMLQSSFRGSDKTLFS